MYLLYQALSQTVTRSTETATWMPMKNFLTKNETKILPG